MDALPCTRSYALAMALAVFACAPDLDGPAAETNIESRQRDQAIVRGEPVEAGVYPWMV